MLHARRADERLVALQRQGRIGTFIPGRGQEAVALGAVYALRPSDWMVPVFRQLAAFLWRGLAPRMVDLGEELERLAEHDADLVLEPPHG